MSLQPESKPKKLYHIPVLQVFGNIREITQNVVTGIGKNDFAMSSDKTG